MFNAPQQDSKRMGLRSRGSVHGKFGLETKKREGSGYCLLQKRPHFQRVVCPSMLMLHIEAARECPFLPFL
eukprot:scaffold31410_cov15-Tisochrysis_lutea.AAC.1